MRRIDGGILHKADLQLAALLPEQKVMLAFDLVFSPKQHVFTGGKHLDHWLTALESLKALQGYDIIIIGHEEVRRRLARGKSFSVIVGQPQHGEIW